MVSAFFSMTQTVPNVQWINHYSTQSSVLGLPTVPAAIDANRNTYVAGYAVKAGSGQSQLNSSPVTSSNLDAWAARFDASAVSSIYDNSLTYSNIKTYPNPTNDLVFIELENFGISAISLFNMMGEEVSHTVTNNYGKQTLSLSLKNLPQGTYLLKIQNNKEIKTGKIIKQ